MGKKSLGAAKTNLEADQSAKTVHTKIVNREIKKKGGQYVPKPTTNSGEGLEVTSSQKPETKTVPAKRVTKGSKPPVPPTPKISKKTKQSVHNQVMKNVFGEAFEPKPQPANPIPPEKLDSEVAKIVKRVSEKKPKRQPKIPMAVPKTPITPRVENRVRVSRVGEASPKTPITPRVETRAAVPRLRTEVTSTPKLITSSTETRLIERPPHSVAVRRQGEIASTITKLAKEGIRKTGFRLFSKKGLIKGAVGLALGGVTAATLSRGTKSPGASSAPPITKTEVPVDAPNSTPVPASQVRGASAPTPGLSVPKEQIVSFGEAFSKARKSGLKEFEYKGKKFHTKLKEEVIRGSKPPPESSLKNVISRPEFPAARDLNTVPAEQRANFGAFLRKHQAKPKIGFRPQKNR